MDNETKDIKIAKLELLEWGNKITADGGMVFNLSKLKKDGTPSLAWEQFGTMELGVGSEVNVWFAEVPNKHGGTSRYIRSFRESSPQPASVASSVVAGKEIPNTYTPERQESREQYGKRLAIHGMVNGLLASGVPPKEVSKLLPDLIHLEDAIDLILSGATPTDDLDVEDISF